MDEINISVDEILAELDFQRGKKQHVEPVSDMKRVNDIVEQLLVEKRNSQLKKDMTQSERENFSREIKAQTKSITKQYEKFVKETTRQLKRQQREEKVVERELNVDSERKRIFEQTIRNAKASSKSLHLVQVASNQKLRVKAPARKEIFQEPSKREKFDAIKQSAHIDHIKREMINITSHFGNVRMEDASVEEGFSRSHITPNTYKEFKKKRNKKIDAFLLNPATKENENGLATAENQEENKRNRNQMFIVDEERLNSTTAFDSQTESLPMVAQETQAEIAVEAHEMAKASLAEEALENPQMPINISLNTSELGEVAIPEPEPLPSRAAKAPEKETSNAPLVEEMLGEEQDFTDMSQKKEFMDFLTREKKMIGLTVSVLAVLSLCAVVFSFVGRKEDMMQLFGMMSITPMTYAILNMLMLIVATAFSHRIFSNAIESFTTRKPSKDVLYSLAVLITFAVNLLFMFQYEKLMTIGVHLYTPIVIIALLFNFVGKRMIVTRVVENFEYIAASNKSFHTVSFVRNYKVTSDMAKGILSEEPMIAKSMKTAFPENFFEHSFQSDTSDELGMKLSLVSLPVAIVASLMAFFIYKDVYVAVSALGGMMAVVTTLVGGLIVAFPLNDTANVTTHFGDMTPSVGAIEKLEGVNALLLDAYDLFPSDTVVLHGIKTFSGKRIDDAIVDAASVVCQSRSILANVFLGIIANNSGLLRKVDTIIYEDLMGISAWVADRRVLIGNRDLMINHSIPVPKQEYEAKYQQIGQDIIYLSTDGELSAAFIIQIIPNKEIFDAMNLLENNEVKAIVKTVDSVLTVQKLADIFHMQKENIKVLPSRLHKAYEDEIEPSQRGDGALTTNGSFLGYLISTIATKKLSYCVRTGRVLNLVSVMVGLILFLLLLLFGKAEMLSCLLLLAQSAIFGLIYIIYQKNIHL